MQIRVGTRKGLFTIEKINGAWKVSDVAFLGDPVSMMLTDPRDGSSYAALNLGHFGVKLHRQNKAGGAWEEIAAPAYPPKPEGVSDREPNSGKEIPWATQMIWALEAGGDPGELWAGTLPGGLFHSRDGGRSWKLVESLWNDPRRREWSGGGADWPGIHSVCVDPKNPARVTIGVSTGGIWKTEDRGASWKLIGEGMKAEYMPPGRESEPAVQDVHRVVACPSATNRVWVQHHCGVFVSDDGAANFREITAIKPNKFGFAVAVHPSQPDTAWFVPAVKDERRYPSDGKVVVARTQDGGASFDVLRDGLPQEHAYDLVYRHCLDVDASGTTLAFGSTTGSLWVTENGGDRWTLVNAHLPPIYAVRIS